MPRRYTQQEYFDIARAMKAGLPVKDRKHNFRTYGNCFVGKEAASFLKHYLGFANRAQAVRFGVEMNRQIQCWDPVPLHNSANKNQELKDGRVFFRWTDFESRRTSVTLQDIAREFRQGVPVADRSYRFKIYKKCFTGKQAVDFLVKRNFAATRAEAVVLGRKLQKEFNLFVHVHGEHKLKDENLFYQKLSSQIGDDSSRMSLLLESSESERLVEAWLLTMGTLASSLYMYLFEPESNAMFLLTAMVLTLTIQRYVSGIRVVSTPEACKSKPCKSKGLTVAVKRDASVPALMRDGSDTTTTSRSSSRDSLELVPPAVPRNSVVEMKGWEMGTSTYFDYDVSAAFSD